MVNPNNSGGNVERWLVEVEIMMKKGLAYSIDSSMVDHASSDRMDWVQKWPGQVRVCERTRQGCNAPNWNISPRALVWIGPASGHKASTGVDRVVARDH